MRSKCHFRECRRQRGDVLLEALISVLVMSIIGAGTAYISSRIAMSAKNVRANGAATAQMRLLLQQYGADLCSGSPANGMAKVILPGSYASQKLKVQCSAASNAMVGGLSVVQPRTVVLCVPSNTEGVFEGAVKVGSDPSVTC